MRRVGLPFVEPLNGPGLAVVRAVEDASVHIDDGDMAAIGFFLVDGPHAGATVGAHFGERIGLGLEPVHDFLRADGPSGFAARGEGIAGLEFGVAGANEGVGEEMGAVVGEALAAGAGKAAATAVRCRRAREGGYAAPRPLLSQVEYSLGHTCWTELFPLCLCLSRSKKICFT